MKLAVETFLPANFPFDQQGFEFGDCQQVDSRFQSGPPAQYIHQNGVWPSLRAVDPALSSGGREPQSHGVSLLVEPSATSGGVSSGYHGHSDPMHWIHSQCKARRTVAFFFQRLPCGVLS